MTGAPQVQYAKTSDGVSIAYYALGEGTPLVYLTSWPYQHLQLEWQDPLFTSYYELILETRRLIRFDGRGSGLSERSVSDFSLEALLLDLDAVVDQLGLETFDLLGHQSSGPLAITYAARNPNRLSHLVLWNTYTGADYTSSIPQITALRGLVDTDYEMFAETAAHVIFGWSEGEKARRFAAFMRESVSQDNARASIAARLEMDVTELLSQVNTPTLVVHQRGVSFPSVDNARGLASGIPNARLLVSETDYASDVQAYLGPILEFLSEGDEVEPESDGLPADIVHTILFTDLVGHTEMMSRLGDDRGRDVLREHERIVREALAEHSGTEVKTMGDGFMASFGSVTKAVECAIALQRAFAERESDEPLSVRVGINAGEPIEEDGDLFGATVILASRIAAKAEGAEILVADTVRGLCSGKGFLFADRGEFVAKGFEDPVRIYEVRWSE